MDGLYVDHMWSRCNRHGRNGVYIWTAGQREDPTDTKTKFVWKSTTGNGNQAMHYTNWNRGEPNNYGNNESCLNLFRKRGFTWNDEPCHREYCFICEARGAAIRLFWGPQNKRMAA